MEQSFIDVYTKFKINFYKKIFKRFETREASLTAVETFCVEVIHALKKPTINEFARFVEISQANAAYKVQSLVKKGYITKERSDLDRREYRLSVTEKFFTYYDISSGYMDEVLARIRKRFSDRELDVFTDILDAIDKELTPEIRLGR
jgi:DNA-binding MarR family transcriptional regulator